VVIEAAVVVVLFTDRMPFTPELPTQRGESAAGDDAPALTRATLLSELVPVFPRSVMSASRSRPAGPERFQTTLSGSRL
jgi:hypothetical protein